MISDGIVYIAAVVLLTDWWTDSMKKGDILERWNTLASIQ